MKLDRVIAVRNSKTIYRDGDRCIKVFNEQFTKADVLNEALNQARMEEIGVNIPKVLEVINIDGKWAIVSEFIKGKTLKMLMDENPDKKEEYMNLFVDLHLEVIGKKCPYLMRLKEKMDQKIGKADIEATMRFDLHNRLVETPKHNKVCHGDFTPANIIISEDGKPYIIDWSHVTRGNASEDAARTYLKFVLAGNSDTAEEYLSLFCEKDHTEREYVFKWVPLVAAALSVDATESEKEILMRYINTQVA